MRRFSQLAVLVPLAGLCAGLAQAGHVIRDGTVGPSGALAGPDFAVPDTDGQVRGDNLFHSFSQFDIDAGETVTFTGPENIHNLLARVTGGSPSTIDGLVDTSSMPNANFLFINPDGVIFGPNAFLNVSGSFAVTTADYVLLADGGRFDVRTPVNDVLTTAPPSAFGFLGPTFGPITFNGITEDPNNPAFLTFVPDFKSIWMIGGEIQDNGSALGALGGEIVGVSIASVGELGVDLDNPRAQLDTSDFTELGTIRMDHRSAFFVDGSPGGLVWLEADRIAFSDHSGVSAYTDGDTPAGGIVMRARSAIELRDGSFNAVVAGAGQGGDILLTAPTIELFNIGLGTTTVADGAAGNIQVNATEVTLAGGGGIAVNTGGAGASGILEINADRVVIQDSAQLQAFVTGGPSGAIRIEATTVELSSGGAIVSDSTAGAFPGSDVHITARTLVLNDTAPNSDTRISSQSRFDGSGGGNIVLDVDQLVLKNQAAITTTSENAAPAGSVTVNAINVTVDDASIASAATADGVAGSINLNLAGSLLLQNDGLLSVSAAVADGGNINVTAGSEIRLEHARITAQAAVNGGNVNLTAPALVYLLDSTITAQAVMGDGGNVTIDPTFVIFNGSLIDTSAGNDGGDITIVADYVLSSPGLADTLVFTGDQGVDGTVSISSPEVDLAGNLVALEDELLNAEAQLGPHCAIRLPGGVSSFVVTGRGGAPVSPDALLPAPPTLGGDRPE